MPYPEGYQPNSAPGQTLPFSEITNFEYELGRPYIQSHGLSFSYGAMKGRASQLGGAVGRQAAGGCR